MEATKKEEMKTFAIIEEPKKEILFFNSAKDAERKGYRTTTNCYWFLVKLQGINLLVKKDDNQRITWTEQTIQDVLTHNIYTCKVIK
jgi:hypothetical protein